jgi:Domain of unknown function (DUF222)
MDEAWQRLTADVSALVTRPVYGLPDTELAETALVVHAVSSRCIAVLAGLVREAEGRDVPRQQGAASTVAWLRDLLRITPADARTIVTMGEVLDARPVLADAILDGAVNTGHAMAIGQTLADVPPTEPGLVDKVETILIGHAAQFEPRILRRLGERILAHVNPDLADHRLRDRLDREQRHAQQRRGFTLAPDGLGGMRLFGILDLEGAAIIEAAIEPLTVPARGHAGPDLRRPPPAALTRSWMCAAWRCAAASYRPTGANPPSWPSPSTTTPCCVTSPSGSWIPVRCCRRP